MFHKIREAMASENANEILGGIVEVDGVHRRQMRPANKSKRIDRRLAKQQTARRVVVAVRERKGRTLTFVVRKEADGVF